MAVFQISRSLALLTALIMTSLVMTSANPLRTLTQERIRADTVGTTTVDLLSVVGSEDNSENGFVYGDEDEEYTSDSYTADNDEGGGKNGLLDTLASGRRDCSAKEYFHIQSQECRLCSSCPPNQIIRATCSKTRNTMCGPFFEFNQFLQSHAEGSSHRENAHPGKDDSSAETEIAGTDSNMTSLTLTDVGTEWRNLAVALIIVLAMICGIIVFASIYVLIVCRRAKQQNQYLRQPEFLRTRPDPDSEPRYVETYFTSSRDRIKTSRHLPVYQQIYTGSHFLPPLTSSLKNNVTSSAGSDPSDHEYIYINCPDDVVHADS